MNEPYFAALKEVLAEILSAFILGLILSWLLFSQEKIPKETVCKDYIRQTFDLSKQVEHLQLSFNAQKTDLIKTIKLKEAKLCIDRIEKYKAVCETLRCEICKRAK
jgi:predicted RND superfamily exporter protein